MSNFRGQVQGFAVGATVVAGLMLGMPALFSPASPFEDMDEMAATFGVEIVWTSVSACTPARADAVGCYLNATPTRIYVSPDMSPEFTRHIVLHEIGHVIQARLRMPQDECAADRFAQSLGSDIWAYSCVPD